MRHWFLVGVEGVAGLEGECVICEVAVEVRVREWRAGEETAREGGEEKASITH